MEGSQPNGKERREPDYLEKCPGCKGRIVEDRERGETYCEECGEVYDTNMPGAGSGTNDFDEEGRPSPSTGPLPTYLRHDKGLSTQIDRKNKDAGGKHVRADVARRLRQTDNRAIMDGEGTYVNALTNLKTYGSKMGIPKDIMEQAARHMMKDVRGQLVRGHSYDEVIGALYDILCTKNEIPRPLDLIAKECHCKRKSVGKMIKILKKNIKEFNHVQTAAPEDYLTWLCSELELSANVRTKAKDIILQGREMQLDSGRNPVGIAGMAVYIGSKLEHEIRSQREICNKTYVTEVTIRNNYKLYVEKLNLNIDAL